MAETGEEGHLIAAPGGDSAGPRWTWSAPMPVVRTVFIQIFNIFDARIGQRSLIHCR